MMIFRFKSRKRARKALNLKIEKGLRNHYGECLENFDVDKNLPQIGSDKIWIFWLQGIENAPDIVKRCVKSISHHFPEKDIVILDHKNYKQFVFFPDYIWKKHKEGKIPMAQFSDLLRLELLITYGGLWVDATVFCSGRKLFEDIQSTPLFLFCAGKRKEDSSTVAISNWLIYARSNNRLLLATRMLLYEYWKQENYLKHYFLFHVFFAMVANKYIEDWLEVPIHAKEPSHRLQSILLKRYDQAVWNEIVGATSFHKLTYRLKLNDFAGTYYEKIINTVKS